MHPAFSRVDHRPWPLPAKPWRWRQTWSDLLFAHWPIATAEVRALVPPDLTVQEFEGTSWIGVVPFQMSGVMLRHLPDVPGVSAFPEINLRAYVEYDGKPGVFFLSLDATKRLAVWVGRRMFHLPYHRAHMSIERHPIAPHQGWFDYHSSRVSNPDTTFVARYRPTSPPFQARSGTLEYFLTERYCLYAATSRGTLTRTDIHHHPWPLQKAEAAISTNTLATAAGVNLRGPPAHLLFADRLDVAIWSPVATASVVGR